MALREKENNQPSIRQKVKGKNFELYQGDPIRVMQSLPDSCVDLLLISVGGSMVAHCSDMNAYEQHAFLREILELGKRKMKRKAHLALYEPNENLEWLQSMEMFVRILPEEALILDCFFGEGMAGVAVLKAKRRYVGIEPNAERFEKAKIQMVEGYDSY